MGIIGINDLNKLAGKGNLANATTSAIKEGDQTLDKIQDIAKTVNAVLEKVNQFKGQAQQNKGVAPTNAPQIAPQDMMKPQRATIVIDEARLVARTKEFMNNIPEVYKQATLQTIIAQGQGSEGILKAVMVNLIKEVTSIQYVN